MTGQAMMREHKLRPVMKLKQRREQEAGKRLGEVDRERLRHHRLVDQLTTYRNGYIEQMQKQQEQGLTVRHLTDYRAMVARIDASIEREKTALQWAENDWQQAHHVWQSAHAHVEALNGLVDSYRREGRKQRERIEEQQQEEFPIKKPR